MRAYLLSPHVWCLKDGIFSSRSILKQEISPLVDESGENGHVGTLRERLSKRIPF